MKFQIYLKNPDGFSNGIEEAARESIDQIQDLDDDEREILLESRKEKYGEAIEKWVEYGECVTLEFDTDKGTAHVVPRK